MLPRGKRIAKDVDGVVGADPAHDGLAALIFDLRQAIEQLAVEGIAGISDRPHHRIREGDVEGERSVLIPKHQPVMEPSDVVDEEGADHCCPLGRRHQAQDVVGRPG